MFESSGRGRRAEVPYCLDCHRKGLTREPNEQGKVAGEREFGVYCKDCQYERNRISRNKKAKLSTKKSFVHGRWPEIPERVRERLCNLAQSKAAELRRSGSAIMRTKAFEYLCVEMAVALGRQITTAEEARLGKPDP